MARIRDIAQICKSKNAGPFQVTIDVLFEDAALYRQVKATGVLNAALFARLYGVAEEDVLFTPYDAAVRLQGDPAAAACPPATSATRTSTARSSTRRCSTWRSRSRPAPTAPAARVQEERSGRSTA